MNKKFIIYKHTNKINNKVYIGCTCRSINARAGKNGKNYSLNKRFWNDIQLFGWNNFEHKILYDNIQTLEEATELESKEMKRYESFIPEKGYNIHSSSNAKSACSSNLKIKVYQYDLNGNYLNEFNSMNQASIYAKCDSSQISRSCKNHKQQAGGYLWRVKKYDILPDNIYKKRYNNSSKKVKTTKNYKHQNKKLIFCFDNNFNFIKIYKSYKEIEANGLSCYMIKRNIKLHNLESYNNMKWSKSICPIRMCEKA